MYHIQLIVAIELVACVSRLDKDTRMVILSHKKMHPADGTHSSLYLRPTYHSDMRDIGRVTPHIWSISTWAPRNLCDTNQQLQMGNPHHR